MAKAFRRALQSVRQGDESALTYWQLGDGAFEAFVLFPNSSSKTFPVCEHVNMTMLLSFNFSTGSEFLECKQNTVLVWKSWWLLGLGQYRRVAWWQENHPDMSKHELPPLKSMKQACIRKMRHDWSTSAIPLCCLSILVAFSCPDLYQDLLAHNSDNTEMISCHWHAFECISRQLLMILVILARGQ